MRRKLTVEIDCGDETCYSEPGKPCEFVHLMKFGTVQVCGLFPMDEAQRLPSSKVSTMRTFLETGKKGTEHEGWLLRCEACLDAEKFAKEGEKK